MAEVRDIARIRDISGRSIDQEIPDIEDPDSLRDAAALVHRKLINDKLTPASPERKRNGLPGKRWQGRIVDDVMFKLWPRLGDRVLVTEEQSRDITGRLMAYLMQCGMLYCEQKTTRFNSAVWWISDHWTPMDIRHVDDPEPVMEPIAEEQVAGGTVVFKCRVCDVKYSSMQARGGHEFSTHRVVVGPDSIIYSHDDPNYTPRYIVDALMRILEVAEKPLTFNAISGLAYDIDPRMGKPDVRKALTALEETGAVNQSIKGRFTVYELVSEESTEAEIDTVLVGGTLVEVVSEEGVETQVSGLAPVPMDFASSVDFVRHVVLTARGQMNAVLESIDEMARYAAAKEQEIAALRMRLVGAANGPELVRLKEELAAVTKERDGYKAKLDNLSKALSGLGVK